MSFPQAMQQLEQTIRFRVNCKPLGLGLEQTVKFKGMLPGKTLVFPCWVSLTNVIILILGIYTENGQTAVNWLPFFTKESIFQVCCTANNNEKHENCSLSYSLTFGQ